MNRNLIRLLFPAASLAFLFILCAAPLRAEDAAPPDPRELSGGATTVFNATPDAYALPARNLSARGRRLFAVGNAFFNDNWLPAPSEEASRDGLGPLFNAQSCSSCHPKDGRGSPQMDEDGLPIAALLVRLSAPGANERGEPNPEPNYGRQFQNRAILGMAPEVSLRISDELIEGAFADGERYALQKPRYTFAELAYGPLNAATMTSPRLAPAVFGLGLLEAVPSEAILAQADPDDVDGDGISGRANRVWDARLGRPALGRFGWKANQPTLEQQIAAAFNGDIGITSEMFPEEELSPGQAAGKSLPNGGEPELGAERLARVNFYIHTLGVPARRNIGAPEVLRGEALFAEIGCAKCHTPEMKTGASAEFPELANQILRPYTDLLLHDMGEGLADGRPDFEATGSEWRTPPLWGLGLLVTVNGHTRLLHDGRARSPQGAILWHGGEAEPSRERYRALPRADRAALLAFLNSL